MTYELQTKESILNRMLAEVDDSIDKRQGSIVYDMQSPAAIELELAYIELGLLLDKGFADTAYGEYLDRRVAEMGVIRKGAVKATGSITFTGTDGATIPKGSRVSTDSIDAVYFVTLEDAVISDGTATVKAEAEVGGIDGNVTASAIRLVIGDYVGVTQVTNTSPFVGGVDAESDEALLQRYLDRISKPSTSGNVYHYEQWAKEVAGILDAKVYPVWNGNGTVKVILLSSNMTAPTPEKVQEVTKHIEANRPIGAAVTVEAAAEVKINVNVTLSLDDGYEKEAVKAQVEAKLRDYLKVLAFSDPIVRYARIGTAILSIDGVLDYTDLKVNGGTSNIHIDDGSVAVVGTVTAV